MRGVGVLILVLVAAVVCGCSRVQYVPVERVVTDSVLVTDTRVDSVYMRDSVYIVHRGDTVWAYKDRYIYKWRERTDTVWRSRTDSVTVPVPVERELSGWQKWKMEAGGWLTGALGLAVIAGGIWVWRRLKG